jgi:hypothetical protein
MAWNAVPTVRGYDMKEVVSALQKAIRRSDDEAASVLGSRTRPLGLRSIYVAKASHYGFRRYWSC